MVPFVNFCTPKTDDTKGEVEPTIEKSKVDPSETQAKLESYAKEISLTGFIAPEKFVALLESYNTETDEVKRLKLCIPIGQAMVSYRMAELRNEKEPVFTKEQQAVVKNAEAYCLWAINTLKFFEKGLTDQELKTIAPESDSLVTIKKSVFAGNDKCTEVEFKKVVTAQVPELTKPDVVSAVMSLAATSDDYRKKDYLIKYIQVVEHKKPEHGPLIAAMATELSGSGETQSQENTPSMRDRVHAIRERSTETLRKNGIRDVNAFVKDAVKISPNCLGQISIDAVHLSRQATEKENPTTVQ